MFRALNGRIITSARQHWKQIGLCAFFPELRAPSSTCVFGWKLLSFNTRTFPEYIRNISANRRAFVCESAPKQTRWKAQTNTGRLRATQMHFQVYVASGLCCFLPLGAFLFAVTFISERDMSQFLLLLLQEHKRLHKKKKTQQQSDMSRLARWKLLLQNSSVFIFFCLFCGCCSRFWHRGPCNDSVLH